MKQFLIALALLCGVIPAGAGSTTLQAQYPVNAGFNQGSAQSCPGWINNVGLQCVQVPGRIIGWSGTVTVKTPGIELLSQVLCNGELIWQGEQFQGTVVVTSPAQLPNELTGPCYISYQAGSESTQPSGFEIQLTIFFQ